MKLALWKLKPIASETESVEKPRPGVGSAGAEQRTRFPMTDEEEPGA
jgi:hypothetical protein